MFEFEHIEADADAQTLSCRYRARADLACFDGHFPGRPLMPAVAQLALLQALITAHGELLSIRGQALAGGSGLKFIAPIRPGDHLRIQLQRQPSGKLRCSLENAQGLVTKGMLRLTEANDD
jgi:3-hydroxymyristoyl/3-hydroxydecanoyl-(acyl carrier protein) dehydratase